MIDILPQPIALQLGPLTVAWYGVAYAVGLALTYWVVSSEVRRRGLSLGILANGFIIVAIAALIGGRLYHVIDQWQLYKDDLLKIVLPPYSGLGVYGGIVTGFAAGLTYARWKRQSLWTWMDCAAPGILMMQAVARWGNFFNQELYGPPTTLPWGILIDCEHRTLTYACEATPAYTHFHPLFLYESLSGLLGTIVLLTLARRSTRLRPGDIVLLFFVWFGTTRFLLEPLRSNNWTFFGIPTASIISATFVLGAIAILLFRHRPGAVAPAGSPDADEAEAAEAEAEGAEPA
ncbi:MAG: prolipoprotein diacylglyceryl transferase, partial [Coriobacteriaceae bacterium]|nr:prolipoprotein diacylglyceryl transferase [Coriobacteriaceae bacterium]